MTGPLAFDEVLSAWERAGGKPPYSPLPTDLLTMQAWANAVGGLAVSGSPATIDVRRPEDLDQVSRFLQVALGAAPGGLDRADLLEAAAAAGLKQTTVATALSMHPAVRRVGQSIWALRGHTMRREPSSIVSVPRRSRRLRPTSFTWASDGALKLEFSVPGGPSPVVAVPKAISELVEERQFTVAGTEKARQISVRNARLWGFAPLLAGAGLASGSRAVLTLNLLSGTATLNTAERQGITS